MFMGSVTDSLQFIAHDVTTNQGGKYEHASLSLQFLSNILSGKTGAAKNGKFPNLSCT